MSFKYLIIETTCYLMSLQQNENSLCLFSDQPGEHWWNPSNTTQGVPGLLVEWMWGSEMWLWFLCCGTIWILQELHVRPLDGYSSSSGLVFPRAIHRGDTGFTWWVNSIGKACSLYWNTIRAGFHVHICYLFWTFTASLFILNSHEKQIQIRFIWWSC